MRRVSKIPCLTSFCVKTYDESQVSLPRGLSYESLEILNTNSVYR